MTGCGLLRKHPSPPTVKIGSLLVTNDLDSRLKMLDVLQAQVTRFADKYALSVAQAADKCVAQSTNAEVRIDAIRWKLGQATAAWVDASGPNPVLNMLDLTVLAIMSRMVLEDRNAQSFGPGGSLLLEEHRRLETNLWTSVCKLINSEQQQQLLQMIEEWRRRNPGQQYAAMTRFRELALAVGRAPPPTKAGPNSILSLLFLDPLAGLDPTAVALEETRQLAERVMYYTQRMPTLLNWQVQLLALQLAAQPESRQILSDADRFTSATEAFAKVADQLPQLINDQREAAIRQVLEGVASERTNLLAGLAAEEKKARVLLTEAKEALDAGSGMATSVQAAIKSLDEFVHFVSPTNQATAATNSRPFNVLDYGQAAGQVSLMAQDLRKVLEELNQTTPELTRLTRDTTTDAERVMDHAFWLGLTLCLAVLAGMLVAGLIYRAVACRLQRRDPS